MALIIKYTTDMSTAAYIRVSSDKQDVTRQRESIGRWAERNEPITLWFEDSEGRNPRDMAHKRAGFQRLLKAVEAGLVSRIIVDSQDRFGTRDAHQWGAFLTTLHDHDCKLFDASGKELSADDDASILTGTLGALTSTREQKEKAHRSLSGKIAKAKAGEYQGGNPPYGFDVVCYGADGKEKWRTVYVGHYQRWKTYPDGTREQFDGKDNSPRKDANDTLYLRPSIQTDRVKVAKQIFDWYATEAIAPGQIATRLRELGIPAVFGEWNKVKIKQMLRHPVYIGLPTWNKRGGSRFCEFVDGQVQPVNSKAKLGRYRAADDYLQPNKPLFKPIVDHKTWDKVQAKMDAAKQGPKRAAQTDDLYLKPFLVCGQCGQPMRASRGSFGSRLFPSYFCGTYGTYGKNNPTGCHCHRVKHDLVEKIVVDYVKEFAPKVADLLKATQTGDLKLAKPLLQQLRLVENDRGGFWLDMLAFIEERGTKADLAKLRKAGANFDTLYGLVFERVRPKLEKQIATLEAELDSMLLDFRTLSPKLRERANKTMEAKQAEIDALRRDVADLRVPWSAMQSEVAARKTAFDHASKVLANGADGRRKAEALASVIDRVTLHYRHTEAAKNNGRSYLDRVEIQPISGDSICYTDGIRQAKG